MQGVKLEKDIYYDFNEFRKLMDETVANLKKMTEMQNKMHWQFGDLDPFPELVQEMNTALDGWISSNC